MQLWDHKVNTTKSWKLFISGTLCQSSSSQGTKSAGVGFCTFMNAGFF